MALGLFAGQTREQGQAGANAAARIQHGHRCRGMFAGNSVFELSYCTGMQEASVEDEERYAIAQDMDVSLRGDTTGALQEDGQREVYATCLSSLSRSLRSLRSPRLSGTGGSQSTWLD